MKALLFHVLFHYLIWSPRFETHAKRIESIQRRFTRFALRKIGWSYETMPPYPLRCQLLSIETLEDRRSCTDALFMFDLIQNNIDCSSLLSEINFNVPSRQLRHYSLLNSSSHRTVYGQNDPLNRITIQFNKFNHLFDFGMNHNSFKRSTAECLKTR